MTTSMLAFGKANALGSLRLSKQAAKLYSSTSAPAPSNGNGSYVKPDDAAAQRDLFVNVLTSNATKRDAKHYLARFRPAKKQTDPEHSKLLAIQEARNARHRQDQDRLDRLGVSTLR